MLLIPKLSCVPSFCLAVRVFQINVGGLENLGEAQRGKEVWFLQWQCWVESTVAAFTCPSHDQIVLCPHLTLSREVGLLNSCLLMIVLSCSSPVLDCPGLFPE